MSLPTPLNTTTINSVLSTDNYPNLTLGNTYNFEKKTTTPFLAHVPIWLVKMDWCAQAEITVISQKLEGNTLTGTFRVDYIYQNLEQQAITAMFVRMYSGLTDANIYLLSSEQEYTTALKQGVLTRESINTEGFIHAAPKSQLTRIANKFYKNIVKPLILIVDKNKITAQVKWEPATGGLYPHIYGELNTDAIIETQEIALNENGEFCLNN